MLEAAARELQERVRQLEAEREEQQVRLLSPCSDLTTLSADQGWLLWQSVSSSGSRTPHAHRDPRAQTTRSSRVQTAL